jgi:hypothetical protein
MPGTLYLCEANGARVLAYGSGITQQGTEYQMALETWDAIPMGEAGDCYFRGIDFTVEYTNGFHIGITPVVDGVELPEQIFTGNGTGIQPLQAQVAVRGTRIAMHARTITRTGDIIVANAQAQFVPLREVP